MSPRVAAKTFVTRKITRAIAIAQDWSPARIFGNMDFCCAISWRKDYVRMQWMMLQQEQPEDFATPPACRYSAVPVCGAGGGATGDKLRFEAKALMRKGSWYPRHDAPV